MNSLKSFEGTPVRRSGATVQLLTLAGGQLPAVISNQRSSQVGVRASEECGREQRKTKNFASYKKPSRFIIFMSMSVVM